MGLGRPLTTCSSRPTRPTARKARESPERPLLLRQRDTPQLRRRQQPTKLMWKACPPAVIHGARLEMQAAVARMRTPRPTRRTTAVALVAMAAQAATGDLGGIRQGSSAGSEECFFRRRPAR